MQENLSIVNWFTFFSRRARLSIRLSAKRQTRLLSLMHTASMISQFLCTAIIGPLIPGFMMGNMSQFGSEYYGAIRLISIVFKAAPIGFICCIVILKYGFMHCWLNFWAEVVKFADRSFYGEWWLAEDSGQFYKRINMPVYDWLMNYVYKESCGPTILIVFPISLSIRETSVLIKMI